MAESTEDKPYGPIEMQVRRDLDRMGKLDVGVRGSLAAIATRLARALDSTQDDDLTRVSQVSLQLRQTLVSLSDVSNDPELIRQLLSRLSTPTDGDAEVRDAEDDESADVGATGS